MLRTALLRSARSASSQAIRRTGAIAPSAFISKFQIAAPSVFNTVRCYSAASGLERPEIEGRIVDLLKNFDKVTDPEKLTPTSHFANDLGLDSLDTVEVVMAIEEEFSIEIPDKDADAIHSVDKAVDYIAAQPDAH